MINVRLLALFTSDTRRQRLPKGDRYGSISFGRAMGSTELIHVGAGLGSGYGGLKVFLQPSGSVLPTADEAQTWGSPAGRAFSRGLCHNNLGGFHKRQCAPGRRIVFLSSVSYSRNRAIFRFH